MWASAFFAGPELVPGWLSRPEPECVRRLCRISLENSGSGTAKVRIPSALVPVVAALDSKRSRDEGFLLLANFNPCGMVEPAADYNKRKALWKVVTEACANLGRELDKIVDLVYTMIYTKSRRLLP